VHIYTIYKATNIVNNKIYIGFDSDWPSRKRSHKNSSFNEKSANYKNYFHNSIRKHGFENFVWEIIYQSKNQYHTLNIMEPYFIKEYDSYNSGYNLTLGGEGVFGSIKVSESARQRMLTNNPMKQEFQREAARIRATGVKQSEETKNKKRIKQLGRKYPNSKRKEQNGVKNMYAKHYIFISPLNELHNVIGSLYKFCKENNIGVNIIQRITYGQRENYYNGWKVYDLGFINK